MFSFASSFTWQRFLYIEYVCQKHTLAQSQKSTSVLTYSVAELQISSYFRFSLNTVSVWRSELNCYSNIHLKNHDYWYCPYNFKSKVFKQPIKTSCRIMLPLANSLSALIILPSCVPSSSSFHWREHAEERLKPNNWQGLNYEAARWKTWHKGMISVFTFKIGIWF